MAVDQIADRRKDPLHDHLDTLFVRVDKIALIEGRVEGNAVEEKRIQKDLVFLGEARIDRVELLHVLAPQVSGGHHSGNHDGDVAIPQAGHNPVQIVEGCLGLQTAQGIVAAKLDDDHVGVVAEQPVEPRQSAGRSIARYPGVDYPNIGPLGAERGLEPGRKRLGRRQAESRNKTVAKDRDDRLGGAGGGTPTKDQHQRDRKKCTDAVETTADRPIFNAHAAPPRRSFFIVALGQESGTVMNADPATPDLPGKDLVRLRGVTLTLSSAAGPVEILRGVDFTLRAGEAVGIVGPSGSGKSSMMSIIAGLEKPTGGAVTVAGHDFATLDEDGLALVRRKHVGIVFQSFHLIPTMTALENVAMPLELAGARDAFARAQAALESVGLGSRTGHYPAQLSGGEQQRVALARAFVGEPDLILADEPTGNLDGETGRAIIESLFAIRTQRNTALLLITHEERLATQCDRVLRMADGLLMAQPAVVAAQ